MKFPEIDEALSRSLRAWQLNPPRDPGFRAAVGSRIEAARNPATWWSFARAHAGGLAAAAVVALVLGGWAGREQARSAVAADRAQIVQAYVQTLDAREMWRH